MIRQRWSGDEDAALRRLVAAGTPPGECAASLGRAIKAVRRRAERLGIGWQAGRGRPAGPDGELAAALRASGLSWSDVGARLGLSKQGAQQAAARHARSTG